MKLKVSHQTHYYYSGLTNHSVQYIRMTPQSNVHQQVHNWQLMLPAMAYFQPDGFGNQWTVLTRHEKHNNLQIQAQGMIEINPDTRSMPVEVINPYLYLVDTELTAADSAINDFARPYLESPDLGTMRDFAAALLEAMPYTPNVTHVETTAAQAFSQNLGVCQDHSHVFIAAARAYGIPARYVSGYLFAESDTHLDTHAWAEAFWEGRWYCFDISNQLFNPSNHIYVACGRDYNEAAPVRGMRRGGGDESMYCQVNVSVLD